MLEPPSQTPRGLSDSEQEAYDSLINRGVATKKAERLAKIYDLPRIKRNVKKALLQKDSAKNLAGLIISFIQDDAAGMEEIAKKETKEREEKRQLERRQAYDAFHGTQMAEIGLKNEESKEKSEVSGALELTDFEVEMIKKKGSKAGLFLKKMEKLGLSIDEVKAGRRK